VHLFAFGYWGGNCIHFCQGLPHSGPAFLCWKLLQAYSHFTANQTTKQIGASRYCVIWQLCLSFCVVEIIIRSTLVNLIEPGKPSATASLKTRIALLFCRFVIKYFLPYDSICRVFACLVLTQILSHSRAESWLFTDSAFCSFFLVTAGRVRFSGR
jgi:hypothetical protein